MPAETQDLAALASTLHAAGYAPVPVTIDKAPRDPATGEPLRWKSYQTAPPPPEQIARWFGHSDARGLGLVLSPQLPVRLACLDFDDPEAYREIDAEILFERDDLSDIWRRLHGWHEATPSGGIHLLFTIADPPLIEKIPKVDTLGIGKASHCIMAPTAGYTLASPGRNPERLTAAELELFTDYLRARVVSPEADCPAPRIPASGNGKADPTYPSDDYNAHAEHREILEAHGWRYLFRRGHMEYWRRPGKESGISGTWGYAGQRLFYCFTTNAPHLEEGRAYSPFALYAHFEHGGDYMAASRDLRSKGYGKQSEPKGIKITRHGEIIRSGEPHYDDPEPPEDAQTPPEWPEEPQHEEPAGDERTDDHTASEEPPEEPSARLWAAGDSAALDPVLEDIGARLRHYQQTGSAIRGHRTGIDPLDDKLGGLEPGRVTILQAQPGAGKTTLSNQIAYTLASAGVPVLYVTFENEPADLIRKQLARIADVSPALLDRGTLPESGYDAIDTAVDRFAEAAATLYYLNGTAETTLKETIKGAVYYIRNRHPTGGHPVVMVDYLQQLARIAGGGPRDDMMTKVGMVSRGLTDLAKDPALRCHVWAVSSMGRESYKSGNSAPGMAAGKYSGDLEFDASAVLSLTLADAAHARDSNHAALSLGIVKNRYGAVGTIELEQSLRSLAITPRTMGGPRVVHPNGSSTDRVRSGRR